MNYNKQEYIFVICNKKRTKAEINALIKNLNNKISELKKSKLDTTVSIVTYNNEAKFLIERQDVKKLPLYKEADFKFEGKKSVYYDAVCQSIGLIGEHLENTPEEDRPCMVFFFTEYGAMDNGSVENTVADYNWQIGVQRGKYFWHFDKI